MIINYLVSARQPWLILITVDLIIRIRQSMYLRIIKCAELQLASARFSSLYRLNLFITSMLAIIE